MTYTHEKREILCVLLVILSIPFDAITSAVAQKQRDISYYLDMFNDSTQRQKLIQ